MLFKELRGHLLIGCETAGCESSIGFVLSVIISTARDGAEDSFFVGVEGAIAL